ncbi:MAG: DNA repair protein RecO [Bacteroidota bacterium]
MITHTKAIILRSVDYQESSKIITVCSQEHGKIALLARGVKKPKSKLSGIIDIGSILDVVYYYKVNRSVQSLTEATQSVGMHAFRVDFSKSAVLYACLELVNQVIHDNEVNNGVFHFLSTLIPWLANMPVVSSLLFPYVQLRIMEIIGIGLFMETDETKPQLFLNVASGLVGSEAVDELSYALTNDQARFMKLALQSKNKEVLALPITAYEVKQLITHLDVYFKYHIEGFQERRSDAIFEQMM